MATEYVAQCPDLGLATDQRKQGTLICRYPDMTDFKLRLST